MQGAAARFGGSAVTSEVGAILNSCFTGRFITWPILRLLFPACYFSPSHASKTGSLFLGCHGG